MKNGIHYTLHLAVKKCRKSALLNFFPHGQPWSVYSGKSGYNNTTCYIDSGSEKYILRIYETHKDESKVKLEHEILLKLNQIVDLPFKVPVPFPAKNGETMLRLNDGSKKIACIYNYISGDKLSIFLVDI